jgi:hypothetical protein
VEDVEKLLSLATRPIEDSGSTELAEVLPDVASRPARHCFPEFQTTGRSRDDEDDYENGTLIPIGR